MRPYAHVRKYVNHLRVLKGQNHHFDTCVIVGRCFGQVTDSAIGTEVQRDALALQAGLNVENRSGRVKSLQATVAAYTVPT